VYCYKCLYQNVNMNGKCPSCRQELNLQNIYLLKEKKYNTKLQEVISYIKGGKVNQKFIIYSKWNNILKKISGMFKTNNLENLIYDGKKRNNILNKFSKSKKFRILFVSSKHIISGLNLQNIVTEIIFLEPDYDMNDKILKNKIISCINRLGLKKGINIVEFYVKDSIEDKCI